MERRHSRETILLVEDDPLVRELSQELLETEGYRVVMAEGAEQAELLVKDGLQFHIMLTDVLMPNVTGPALVQKLRLVKPDFKVLFVSGYPWGTAEKDGLENGDAFLAKPFSADSLAQKIREVLDSPVSTERENR